MHTILGAGGAIGSELLRELGKARLPVRLVARNPARDAQAAEVVSADISNAADAMRAVAGSSVVYLVVGLKYDLGVWREAWPRIMANVIEACKRANARLIFFDNVYMYGRVSGAMTEQSSFNPCSRKGEIRARIATTLLDEMKAGTLAAMIARSADFYGPAARTSVANILVFDKLAKGGTAAWLVDDSVPHSFTFTPDAARGLVALALEDSAWNQTWHLPTAAHPPTGKQFIESVAREFATPPRYRVLGRPLLKVAGWFNSDIRESGEMLYQSDSSYVFDASKFQRAFGTEPTSYAEGIKRTASHYRGSPAG